MYTAKENQEEKLNQMVNYAKVLNDLLVINGNIAKMEKRIKNLQKKKNDILVNVFIKRYFIITLLFIEFATKSD